MKAYESPRFDFQELKLFERVADTCWGTASIWLDTNGDSRITNVDINIATGGGCQGSWSADTLSGEIAEFNRIAEAYNQNKDIGVVAAYNGALAEYLMENSVAELKLITAEPGSNWASTKQSSGGGIIIDRS